MGKKFFVYELDLMNVVTTGRTEEEVIDQYERSKESDISMRDYITRFDVDDSLFSKFYRDEQGGFYGREFELSPGYIEKTVEEKIRYFWKDQPQFGEEYLVELKRVRSLNRMEPGQFSKAFLSNTTKKVLREVDRFNNFKVIELNYEDEALHQ